MRWENPDRLRHTAIAVIVIVTLLGAGCVSNEWPSCSGEGNGYFRSEVYSLDPDGYQTPHKRDLPKIAAGTEIEVTVEEPECGGPPHEYVWELRGDQDGFFREYKSPDPDARVKVPYMGRYFLEPTFVGPDGSRVYNGNGLYIRAEYRLESDLPEEGLVTNFTTFCCPSRGLLNLTTDGTGPDTSSWTVRVLVDRSDELIAEETVQPGSNSMIAQESQFRETLGDQWLESIRVEVEPQAMVPPSAIREYSVELVFDTGGEPITY